MIQCIVLNDVNGSEKTGIQGKLATEDRSRVGDTVFIVRKSLNKMIKCVNSER